MTNDENEASRTSSPTVGELDRSDELAEWYAEGNPDGAEVLNAVESHYRRFICVTDDSDLALLAVWTVPHPSCRGIAHHPTATA